MKVFAAYVEFGASRSSCRCEPIALVGCDKESSHDKIFDLVQRW